MTFSPRKSFLAIGAVLGLLAVLTGAFGAHGMSNLVSGASLHAYETGVRFQFYHALVLLVLGLLGDCCHPKLASWAGGLFTLGIILFSGSLYAITGIIAAHSTVPMAIGILTPLGGVCLIGAWVLFLIAVLTMAKPQ